MKIPSDINSDFNSRTGSAEPAIAVRALTDIDGNVGETYILGASDRLVFYSAKIANDFTCHSLTYGEIQEIDVSEDRPFAYLGFRSSDQVTRLKCARYDIDDLLQIKHAWEQSGGGADVAVTPGTTSVGRSESPYIALSAAIHALIKADASKSPEEEKKRELIIGDPELIRKGIEYCNQREVDQLIIDLNADLSQPQKLCLIANLLEVAMIDGVLTGNEKALIEKMREAFGLQTDEVNNIFDVLVVKNKLKIFG